MNDNNCELEWERSGTGSFELVLVCSEEITKMKLY